MPVTEAQFHQLIDFTKKKGVHFYDLQMELADHKVFVINPFGVILFLRQHTVSSLIIR